MKNKERYRGCLLGGAAGDALGYAVEFLRDQAIFSAYGENGITQYALYNGVAQISDDTQMTLFTAEGLRSGASEPYADAIRRSYKDWYRTQTEAYPLPDGNPDNWLLRVPELFSRRAPGITCLSALKSEALGTLENPINRSKGCGGVMRVAPIGLYFAGYSIDEIDRIGAEAAAITHGHPLGYIPAAGLVHMIHLLVHGDSVSILDAAKDMRAAMARQFARVEFIQDFLAIIDKAISLAQDKDNLDLEAIRTLGQGWVAEEALAIAVYCAIKYADDFDSALIAAVNHSGDSDSTGAITGNIVGASLGLQGIPEKYLDKLELKDVILNVADDLLGADSEAEGALFAQIRRSVDLEGLFSPMTGQRPGRCNGDCSRCPPHYGYRYGRWYYGRGHVYGCEFGGNRGDGSL